MKFLCVRCDEPMKLAETLPPDRGSLTAVFSCPRCSNQIAMLTNPYETQLVQSLGVKIGPAEAGTSAAPEGEASRCPFSDVVQGMTAPGASSDGIPWTQEATSRLERVPDFVRPMARAGIEKFARDRGYPRVDERVLDEAKGFFGM